MKKFPDDINKFGLIFPIDMVSRAGNPLVFELFSKNRFFYIVEAENPPDLRSQSDCILKRLVNGFAAGEEVNRKSNS